MHKHSCGSSNFIFYSSLLYTTESALGYTGLPAVCQDESEGLLVMGYSVMIEGPIAHFRFLLLLQPAACPLSGPPPSQKDVDGSLLTGLSGRMLTKTFRKFCHIMLVSSRDSVYSHLKL